MLQFLKEENYPDLEVIICADEPTDECKALEKEYSWTNWQFSEDRMGKIWALNAVAEKSKGDFLIFLDSDLELREHGFLQEIVKDLSLHELVEIKKKIIRDSFVARIVNYDYLSENFTNYLFAKYLHRCIGINGAAFAIRRETWIKLGGFKKAISEDLDLALRAFIINVDFGYPDKAEVWNGVDPSWGVWLRQRRRWGLGLGIWLRDYWRQLFSTTLRNLKIVIPALLILFPSIPIILQFIAISNLQVPRFATVVLLLLSSWQILFAPSALALEIAVVLTEALFFIVIQFITYAFIFYFFSRRLGYAFNIVEFVFFFFVYNPLWLLISLASLFRVIIWRENFKIDWKI